MHGHTCAPYVYTEIEALRELSHSSLYTAGCKAADFYQYTSILDSKGKKIFKVESLRMTGLVLAMTALQQITVDIKKIISFRYYAYIYNLFIVELLNIDVNDGKNGIYYIVYVCVFCGFLPYNIY